MKLELEPPPVLRQKMKKRSRSSTYFQNFKLRWFVLEEGILSYYQMDETHNTTENLVKKGEMNLKCATVDPHDHDKEIFIAGSANVGEKNLFILTSTEDIAMQWRNVIKQHIKYIETKENPDEENVLRYMLEYHKDKVWEIKFI